MSNGNYELYVSSAVDLSGLILQRLTDDPGIDLDPVWSPDGTRIAFSSSRNGNFDIYVVDADGGNLTQLTFCNCVDQVPAWSPDGTRIAFPSDRGGNFDSTSWTLKAGIFSASPRILPQNWRRSGAHRPRSC